MNAEKLQYRFLILPAIIFILAIISLSLWGLKLGIDLAGGSLLEVTYTSATSTPTEAQVQDAVNNLGYGEVVVQRTGKSGFILRQEPITDAQKQAMEQKLEAFGALHENQFTSIGPTIGSELLQKGILALAIVILGIILFIAFAFRKVSKPVASWKYGVITIVSLIHDILVPAGLFALLGHFMGAEVDALFIVGLLTVLGISINDTIVVFDRIRENLRRAEETRLKEPFADTVWRSNKQTLTRSINTSFTVILVLVALYVWGPESTKAFALTLIAGMIAGTYSSIMLAAPLLVAWEKWQKRA